MFVYSYFTVLFLGNHFVTFLLCFYLKLSTFWSNGYKYNCRTRDFGFDTRVPQNMFCGTLVQFFGKYCDALLKKTWL